MNHLGLVGYWTHAKRKTQDSKLCFPFRAKEPLQNFTTLSFSHAGRDFTLVIQRGHLEEIDQAASPAGLRIRASKNHAPESGVDDCSGAHRAGFFGYIDIAVVQPPVANSAFGLR